MDPGGRLRSPTPPRSAGPRIIPPARHCAFCILHSAFTLLLSGCITHPSSSSATPARAVDPIAATPRYWLNKPAAYHATGTDYDLMWYACEDAARHALFRLDREDYRDDTMEKRLAASVRDQLK